MFITPNGLPLEYSFRFEFQTFNNEAEYEAFLVGLRIARELGATNIRARNDSQFIVNQVTKEYQAKDDFIGPYGCLVDKLFAKFNKFTISQIPREDNSRADS